MGCSCRRAGLFVCAAAAQLCSVQAALVWCRVPGARPSPGRPSNLLVAFCVISGSCRSLLTISVLVLSHALLWGATGVPGHRDLRLRLVLPGVLRVELRGKRELRSLGKRLLSSLLCFLLSFFFLVDLRLFTSHHRKEDVGTVRGCVCVVCFSVLLCFLGDWGAVLASWI